MNYRSIAQLSDQVLQLARHLPPDIELIVGVPRSGLLVGNILALYLNLPLADVEGLLAGRTLTTGRRGRLGVDGTTGFPENVGEELLEHPRKVLVVDDSVRYGEAMRRVRGEIEAARLPHEVLYAAVYISPGTEGLIDYYAEVLEAPRFFEWNVLHHKHLSRCCFDMDGVLCRDPEEEENDDGERYAAFIQGTPPILIPTAEIGWIVTSRLERYRPETEAWLDRHGIRYRHLVMLDYPDGATRRRMGTHGAFKADVYRSTDAWLFIESSIRQAQEISRLARRAVFCTDTMQMVHPESEPRNRSASVEPRRRPAFVRRVGRWVPRPVKDALRSVLPR